MERGWTPPHIRSFGAIAAVAGFLLGVELPAPTSASAFPVPSALNSASAFPVPSALPPHGWGTMGDKLFIHGCKAEGLFDPSELALAAKFGLLTVEKGQGLALPGFADGKMAAIAAQWKAARRAASLPDGWALFYLNAHFDWPFFALHAQMEAHPGWPQQLRGASSGEPCLGHGDKTFPQPAEGMLLFNHSIKAVRTAFVNVFWTWPPPASFGASPCALLDVGRVRADRCFQCCAERRL